MEYSTIELIGSVFFALAVLHTFMVSRIVAWSHRFPRDSFQSGILHLLGEIEVVFAIWAAAFMSVYIVLEGWTPAMAYQKSLDFTEPFFIFAIMVICSTRPILTVARWVISTISLWAQKILRTPEKLTDLAVVLIVGPLSGSFITEPAAMTVTAFVLNSLLQKDSGKLVYPLIAVLFVNVSIGGALTSFAAPPILMVAGKWGWDLSFVFLNFGWKSMIAVTINSLVLVWFYRRAFAENCIPLREVELRLSGAQAPIPLGVTFLHLLFLVGVVITGHYQNAFLGIFLLFLGVAGVTQKYHDALRLKESLLVALFLGGIIQFGSFQQWWLTPLLERMSDMVLFGGAVVLTAVTDNAALTYLGGQVQGLSEASKYALVAGAIAGGGLTVIANAPNAAGYSILSNKFPQGINPLRLLKAAVLPTLVAVTCLWIL